MQLLYILVWLTGAVFFALRPKQTGLSLLAFIGSSYYFSPGLLGYVMVPLAGRYSFELGRLAQFPITNATYVVMIVVTLAVIAAGVISMVTWRPPVASERNPNRLDGYIWMLTLLSVGGFIYMFTITGASVFIEEKGEIMERINNRGYILWSTAAVLGFPAAWMHGRKKHCIWFGLMILADIYIGFRLTAVMVALAVFLISVQRSKINGRTLVMLAVIGIALLLYKNIGVLIKNGRWDLVGARLTDTEFYTESLLHSEPMVIQAVLEQALADGMRYDPIPLKFYLMQLMPFTLGLGANYNTGHYFSGNALFVGLDYGVASNPWAEIIVGWGWPAFGLAAVAYAALIVLGDQLFRTTKSSVNQSFLLICFASICFYIHRNNTLYQLNIERQYVYCFLAASVGTFVWCQIAPAPEATRARQGKGLPPGETKVRPRQG